jgi:hypothetical protein
MKVLVMYTIESGSRDILFMRMMIRRMILDQLRMFNNKILTFGMSEINCKIKIIQFKIRITKKTLSIRKMLMMIYHIIRISKFLKTFII